MASERSPTPYLVGLRMLARRELFTSQLRDRLERRDFEPDEVDAAVQQLHRNGALDDRRAALAFARQAAELKGRGRQRTRRELERHGVEPTVIATALDEAYATVDERVLVERALARRLSGREVDRTQFRRLYAALCRQGFEPETVVSVLRGHGAVKE